MGTATASLIRIKPRKEGAPQTDRDYVLALTMTSGRDSSSKRGKCPLLLELASGLQLHATNYTHIVQCRRFSGVGSINMLASRLFYSLALFCTLGEKVVAVIRPMLKGSAMVPVHSRVPSIITTMSAHKIFRVMLLKINI